MEKIDEVEGEKQYGNGVKVAYAAKIYEAQNGWQAGITYVLGTKKEELSVEDSKKAMTLEIMLTGPGRCKAKKRIERAIYLNL